jgi:hypothetical protein
MGGGVWACLQAEPPVRQQPRSTVAGQLPSGSAWHVQTLQKTCQQLAWATESPCGLPRGLYAGAETAILSVILQLYVCTAQLQHYHGAMATRPMGTHMNCVEERVFVSEQQLRVAGGRGDKTSGAAAATGVATTTQKQAHTLIRYN